MSTTATTETAGVEPTGVDPFAELSDDQVLRCRDAITGWEWYYAVDRDGSVVRYHELEDYSAVPVPRQSVVETIGHDRIATAEVSSVHLRVRTEAR